MKPHSVFKVEVCFYAPFKNGWNTKKVGRNEEDNDWLRGISVKSGGQISNWLARYSQPGRDTRMQHHKMWFVSKEMLGCHIYHKSTNAWSALTVNYKIQVFV